MSETFAREILRRNVAQICQTIGWNGIHSTPLDMLVHVLEKHIQTLGNQANRYAEQFNRTEPNLNDLGLVFQDLNINIPELAEYTRSVPPVPPPVCVEQFPKPRDSNLNFLKPGSHEVVTRPMHVHEHLPPMYPEKEQDTPATAGTVEIRQNGIDNIDSSNATCPSPEISVTDSPEAPKEVFKRPIDPVALPNAKKPRLRLDEEERTREISSVMMTMSGFLSPAREGKLPEARPPIIISEKSHDKHKSNSHALHPANAPILDKSDKKSKKNKLLNGKVMKSKRKDKNHKGDSSKSKDISKLSKYPPGHGLISKDGPHHTHSPSQALHLTPSKSTMPPPMVPIVPDVKPLIKKEPIDLPMSKDIKSPAEDAIPVPRKIPISKSPLVSNINPVNKKSLLATNPPIHNVEIKKEKDDEVKLTSQPDRSKINIFKRISNKSKEDKVPSEVNSEKSQSDNLISKVQNANESSSESVRVKPAESAVNNNNTSAMDLSKEMDLRAHEVISIDDDSLDMNPLPVLKSEPSTASSIYQSLPLPNPKDVASVSPKAKKKKHKDKKDKQAKLEAKLLKKQQQQLAFEMAQANKQKGNPSKPPKPSRPKSEKLPPMPPGFPFFSSIQSPRNLKPGPGLIPNTGLIPNSDYLAGFANNPALRGLPTGNLLTNPFALSAAGPGLIPSGFLTGSLGSGINPLGPMGNFPHSSHSSPQSMKIPPMLRRPSLEVIPVENDDDRHKGLMMSREKDRHDKHKSPTIPNILQKHKSKYKDYKSNTFKMPPVQPDITIELNPPRETVKQEPIKSPPVSVRSPTPEHKPQKVETTSIPSKAPTPEQSSQSQLEITEKKKDKSHKKDKKDKKDKDGIKIKKKKDKKDKDKSEKHEKKKKKEKANTADGLVPKLTLKLGSNSSSPMPPTSPDVFKLNIKPVVKKEEAEEAVKEKPAPREHSPSPELAQISALVTRPPKQKTKHSHQPPETDLAPPSPPSGASPTRKNRPPSSHSKYKRILIKPLSKKGHFDDDMASMSEEPSPVTAPSTEPADKPLGVLPTPYYVDDHGNKIWVCPACGRPDNGSPMIGCDGCDGWYHWVCVGITEEPRAEEDWFCKACIAKRSAMVLAGIPSAKKRGRKPKTEKVRDCH